MLVLNLIIQLVLLLSLIMTTWLPVKTRAAIHMLNWVGSLDDLRQVRSCHWKASRGRLFYWKALRSPQKANSVHSLFNSWIHFEPEPSQAVPSHISEVKNVPGSLLSSPPFPMKASFTRPEKWPMGARRCCGADPISLEDKNMSAFTN